jgi:hypothetical protein
MRKIIILTILLIANNSFGYFYYLCVKKMVNKNGYPQHIVLLADYHDKTHPVNKGQRAHLEFLLQKYADKKIKLIVEDLSSVNNDGRMICCKYGINCTDGVLGHLANKARSFGIVVDNVEYRYCRVASIGPLLSNLAADPHSFKSCVAITLMALYKEIAHEIEKIKKYDDGKALNNFYKRAIADVRVQLARMRLNGIDQQKTVANYCAQLKYSKYRKELEKLCIFDSALIDVHIMHSIMCSDAPIIFVVAGGSHVEQVRKVLKKIGCEEVFATQAYSTSQPIDISVIDDTMIFLQN